MDTNSIDLGSSFSPNSTMRSDSPRAGKIKARLQDLEETLILQRSEYDELLDKMEQLEKKQVYHFSFYIIKLGSIYERYRS